MTRVTDDTPVEWVTIEGVIEKQTPKAIYFWDGDKSVWLPKAVCELPRPLVVKKHMEFKVMEWWVVNKGIESSVV